MATSAHNHSHHFRAIDYLLHCFAGRAVYLRTVLMKKNAGKKMKICIVSSSGGHLFKTFQLKPWWNKYPRLWITKKDKFSQSLLEKEKKYYAHFPENRNVLNFFKNLFLACQILRKERPNILFSMGAGVAPPFFIIAKIMGIKTIFMETFILIPRQTLSGKLVHPFADYFLVQNQKLLKVYPKARYWGKCL